MLANSAQRGHKCHRAQSRFEDMPHSQTPQTLSMRPRTQTYVLAEENEAMNWKISLVLSGITLISAIVVFAFGCIAEAQHYTEAKPIFLPGMFIAVTAFFGFVAANKENKCTRSIFLVLSIISAIGALCVLCFCAAQASLYVVRSYGCLAQEQWSYSYWDRCTGPLDSAPIAVLAMAAVAAGIAGKTRFTIKSVATTLENSTTLKSAVGAAVTCVARRKTVHSHPRP